MVLASESLDLADPLQIIHKQRIHGAGGFTLQPVPAMGGKRVPESSNREQRQRDERHPSQGWIGREHDRRHRDDIQQRHAALLRPIDEHALDRIDVFDDASHQIAGSALIKIVDRQPLQAGIDLAPHVIDDILLKGIIDANAQAIEEVAK